MQSQVLDDLVSGKLVACGFQEGASLEQGPTPIPAHLFPRDAEDTAVVDWHQSTLKASGFLFDRIRVTKPRAGTPRKKRVSGPISGGTNPSPPPIAIPAPTPISSQSSKKRGRPRVDAPLRSVVRSLVDSGQLKDKSRKEQIPIIRAAARAEHPTLFLRETQPSRDKIFAALRAEGLITPR